MAALKENLSVINTQSAVTILKNKHQLNKLIVDSKGRPDTFAINLYWDEFRSWHNPKKGYKKGNVVYLQKLHKKGIQLCYRALSEKYNFSEETIRRKIVKLEKLGLLSRDFEISQNYSKVLYNQLVIYIWQQTPHFHNPLGVDRAEVKQLKPSTNHKYISSKYGASSTPHNEDTYTTNTWIGIHTHEDTYLLSTELREREEEAKAYSSSLSKKEKINKKKKAKIQSAEIIQISNTEPEPSIQKSITEIPTLANGFMNEPAKVYQTEKIRVVASEAVIICDHLEDQSYEKSVQLKSRILVEETASISSEEGTVNTGRIDQITQLKTQIFKTFDSKTSEEIMENCTFTELEPNKLGISIKAKFSFSEHDKQTLKACVHMVYGSEIKMVNISTVKQQAAPMPKAAEPTEMLSNCQKWEQFKKELLSFFPEKTGDHILNVWFDKLRVSEDKPNSRIILTGSTFYVDSVYNRFQSAIESVVKKNKVTLELHYENNSQRPIIYKPNGGF
jgi:DNA-binding Lrp family transcriptional regulator